jgi:prophage DNA circulation protein
VADVALKWSWAEFEDAVNIVKRVAPTILGTIPMTADTEVAALRFFVGDLVTNAGTYIIDNTISTRIVIALTQARIAGATMYTLARVRKAALAEAPIGLIGVAVKFMFTCLCLAQEAVALTGIKYTNRDQATDDQAVLMLAFSEAAEEASDDANAAAYMSIITLQGRVARYYADLIYTLPRVVDYRFQVTLPALAMSQVAYFNGERSDELRLQNRVIHPAFMPMTGKMLAV